MDAYDDLLLSEGVCSQLGIVTYHSQVGEPSQTLQWIRQLHQHAVYVLV